MLKIRIVISKNLDLWNNMLKYSVYILTFVFIFIISDTTVRADMGPKPSITLTVTNAEEYGDYYVALLEKRDGVLDENSKLKLSEKWVKLIKVKNL